MPAYPQVMRAYPQAMEKRMRRLIMLFLASCLAQPALAQDESGSARVCRVAVLSNEVGQPDDHKDGLVRLRVFVSTSTSCRSGQVEVGVFPTTACRSRPQTDLDDSKPMTFAYKPNVLQIEVEPGNIGSAVVEISSGEVGTCTFNSHVASCGAVTPSGARCETRDLTEPQPELQLQRGVEREFNRLQ
jgi:hypothetical protein